MHNCLHTLHNLIKGDSFMALKDEMPQTAAWIAQLRTAFCETPAELAAFNAQIKAGMEGQPTFYASENGRTVGRKDQRQGVELTQPLKIAQRPDFSAGNARYKE